MEDEQTAPARHNVGFAMTSAIVIGFACIVVGEMAQQYARVGAAGIKGPVAKADGAGPRFNAIDYGATGTILSPCGPSASGK